MSDWGRRKKMVIFTLQAEMTEKQYENLFDILAKKADIHNTGFDAFVEGLD